MEAKYLPAYKEGLRATFTGGSACPALTCPHPTEASERAQWGTAVDSPSG